MKALAALVATLLLPSLPGFGATVETDPAATAIISRAERKRIGSSSRMEVSMTIVRPTWSRTMTMRNWSWGTRYSLMVVTSPARDKGMASLKREKDLWSWQPSIERAIKVTPSMLGQSWMGSDFTNDDILRDSSMEKDYFHRLLGTDVFDGSSCSMVELTPKPDAPVVWGKIVAWVDADDNYRKIEYRDQDEALVTTMTTWDIRRMDDRSLPTLMRMEPAQSPGNRTEMRILSADFSVSLDESFFSLRALHAVGR